MDRRRRTAKHAIEVPLFQRRSHDTFQYRSRSTLLVYLQIDGKEFFDGVYLPKEGQQVKAACIYYEPEDGREECVRQGLDGTSAAAMTATADSGCVWHIESSGAVD